MPTALSPFQIAGPGASPNDFDFLNGIWRIRNNRLRRRNAGSDDWDEFMANGRFWTLLDGVANVDEFDCPACGFKGMSLRALDLATGTWSILWINSTMGTLLPPVRGGFSGRTGCFVGADTDEGHPVLSASPGTATHRHRAGNRRSRMTAEQRGRPTGPWNSSAPDPSPH